MIDKIKQALKTEFPNLGLGEKALDGVADFLSKTITEESQIGQAVKGAEGILKSFQSEADRRVTDLQRKNQELETENEKLKTTPPNPPTPSTGGDDDKDKEPEWARKLREQQEAILDRQAQEDKASTERALKESARKIMIEKGVTDKLCDEILNSHIFSEGDTAEAISTKGIEKYNFLKSELAPEAGTPSSSQGVTADSDLDAYFAKKKAKNEAEAARVKEAIDKASV